MSSSLELTTWVDEQILNLLIRTQTKWMIRHCLHNTGSWIRVLMSSTSNQYSVLGHQRWWEGTTSENRIDFIFSKLSLILDVLDTWYALCSYPKTRIFKGLLRWGEGIQVTQMQCTNMAIINTYILYCTARMRGKFSTQYILFLLTLKHEYEYIQCSM